MCRWSQWECMTPIIYRRHSFRMILFQTKQDVEYWIKIFACNVCSRQYCSSLKPVASYQNGTWEMLCVCVCFLWRQWAHLHLQCTFVLSHVLAYPSSVASFTERSERNDILATYLIAIFYCDFAAFAWTLVDLNLHYETLVTTYVLLDRFELPNTKEKIILFLKIRKNRR